MSNEKAKADQIAFHFFTKLFHVVNEARNIGVAGEGKPDKWFNLETPEDPSSSLIFAKEARESYRSLSESHSIPPLEIQVLLTIPELGTSQGLVYRGERSSIPISPAPRYVLLESWIIEFVPRTTSSPTTLTEGDDIVKVPTIYKHGILLFRSLYTLLRILPTWNLVRRMRGSGRTGGIGLRLSVVSQPSQIHGAVLGFGTLPTSTHTFPPIPHPLGTLALHTTYLTTPNFAIDEMESVLSRGFMEEQAFVPTLRKAQPPREPPRDSLSGITIADRFILPPRSKTAVASDKPTGASSLPHPSLPHPSTTIPLRRPQPVPLIPSTSTSGTAPNPFRSNTIATSDSLSSSPSFGGLSGLGGMPGSLPISGAGISGSPGRYSSSSRLTRDGSESGMSSLGLGLAGLAHPQATSLGTMTVGRRSGITLAMGSTAGSTTAVSTTAFPTSHSFTTPPSPTPGASGASAHPPSGLGIGIGKPSSLGRHYPEPSTSVGTGGPGGSSGGSGSVGVPSQVAGQRKRYSSSFGHRYTSGTASASGSPASGSGSGGAVGLAGSAGSASESPHPRPRTLSYTASHNLALAAHRDRERDRPLSHPQLEDQGLDTDVDLDLDLTNFMHDIDARKPLIGRQRIEEAAAAERDASVRDKHNEDSSPPSPDQKQRRHSQGGPASRHVSPLSKVVELPSLDSSQDDRRDHPEVFMLSPEQANPPRLGVGTALGLGYNATGGRVPLSLDASPGTRVSTSPPAGSTPMLTTQSQVDDKLKRMNEAFLASLEGLGGSTSKAKREKERRAERDQERDAPRGSNQRPSSLSGPSHPYDSSPDSLRDSAPGSSSPTSVSGRGRGRGLGLHGLVPSSSIPPSPSTPSHDASHHQPQPPISIFRDRTGSLSRRASPNPTSIPILYGTGPGGSPGSGSFGSAGSGSALGSGVVGPLGRFAQSYGSVGGGSGLGRVVGHGSEEVIGKLELDGSDLVSGRNASRGNGRE